MVPTAPDQEWVPLNTTVAAPTGARSSGRVKGASSGLVQLLLKPESDAVLRSTR